MKKLKESSVQFDTENHTYRLKDVALQGVTPIVSWLFPDTYALIPQATLDAAAAHGTAIHQECQLYNELQVPPESYEAREYVRLLNENNLSPLASEYLVSDDKRLASSIDLVCSDYSIYDYKTTSSLHTENVTYQVNIYKYLFELQNPKLSVPRLGVVWLPRQQYGSCAIIPLEVLDRSLIIESIEAYFRGDDPTPYRKSLFPHYLFNTETTVPASVINAQQQIIDFETNIRSLKEQEEQLKQGLIALMEQNGVKKYETDRLILTYVAPSVRRTFDGKSLQLDNPELYARYVHESPTTSSLRIKLK
jgi:hypothetical protein